MRFKKNSNGDWEVSVEVQGNFGAIRHEGFVSGGGEYAYAITCANSARETKTMVWGKSERESKVAVKQIIEAAL